MEYSQDQIPFLAILIKRNKNDIWMDLYDKSRHKRCLPFTSSHPNHCKGNISFCLARTIRAIVENNTQNLRISKKLKSNLAKYHYPDSAIKQGFQRAQSTMP